MAGEAAHAVGDRVTFLGKHVGRHPRLGPDGTPLLRGDGSVRQQRMTIPKRTRGEVVAVDVGAGTLTIQTDAAGRLPSRQVVLTAQEAAGESPASPVRLGHGYAMMVAIAQARGWTDSYLVLTASQLTGLEQTDTAQTRATAAPGSTVAPTGSPATSPRTGSSSATGQGHPGREPGPAHRKVTTLDYLDPGERAVPEERFAPRQSPPRLDATATPAQLEMAERLGRPVPGDATWLEASAALARGHAPGPGGRLALPGRHPRPQDAWRRVASALEEQAARARCPATRCGPARTMLSPSPTPTSPPSRSCSPSRPGSGSTPPSDTAATTASRSPLPPQGQRRRQPRTRWPPSAAPPAPSTATKPPAAAAVAETSRARRPKPHSSADIPSSPKSARRWSSCPRISSSGSLASRRSHSGGPTSLTAPERRSRWTGGAAAQRPVHPGGRTGATACGAAAGSSSVGLEDFPLRSGPECSRLIPAISTQETSCRCRDRSVQPDTPFWRG